MSKAIKKVLFIRSDNMGDVILTTPAITALKKTHPSVDIVFALKKHNMDLVKENPDISQVIPYDDLPYRGFLGFFHLLKVVIAHRFQVVIASHSTFHLSLLVFLARIPRRISPLAKWWSFLFFNKGIRQRRSEVEMHEAEYNLQLLRDLGVPMLGSKFKTALYLSSKMKEKGKNFFQAHSLMNQYKTVAIHPGSSGSSLNCPKEHYVKIGKNISKEYNVLITGGPKEEDLVNTIFEEISENHHYDSRTPNISKYLGKEGVGELMGVLGQCHAMLAPSTGPMHMAVALGKKVVTVFSPIRVQSALRWGPYGVPFATILGASPEDQASVLVPSVNCTEGFKCALSACIHYPCMPLIRVEDIEEHLHTLLKDVEHRAS